MRMRPTLATAAKRRWPKLAENSRPPALLGNRASAARRQPSFARRAPPGAARDRCVIRAPRALVWLTVGKSPDGDDIRPVVGLVDCGAGRVDRRDSREHGEYASWMMRPAASPYFSRWVWRIPL